MNTKNVVIGGLVLIIILVAALLLIPAPKDDEQTREQEVVMFEEDTSLAQIIVEYPRLGYAAADSTLENIVTTYVDDFRTAAEDVGESPVGRPYVLVIEDQKLVETEEHVGILLLVYQDFGGAHGLPELVGINFNKETGEEVMLSDVYAIANTSLEDLSEGAIAHFTDTLGDSFFAEGAEAQEENFSSFLIEEGGITFYFQPYQVAAYALGPQEYTITY